MKTLMSTWHSIRSCIQFCLVCAAAVCQPTQTILAQSNDIFSGDIARATNIAMRSVVGLSGITVDGPAFGSGVIVRSGERTMIVTSAHLSEMRQITAEFSDQTSIDVNVLHADAAVDLALLGPIEGGTPIELGDAAKLGDVIIALGSPSGFSHSASLGIIGHERRLLPDFGNRVEFLQIDAPSAQGSSGGAVVNLRGALVGIVSRGVPGGPSTFAVPVEVVKKFLGSAGGAYANSLTQESRGYLPVHTQPLTPRVRAVLGFPGSGGLVVSDVPESEKGAKDFRVGDILLSVGGVHFGSAHSVPANATAVLSRLRAGPERAQIWRAASVLELSLNLRSAPLCVGSLLEGQFESFQYFGEDDGCSFPKVVPYAVVVKRRGEKTVPEDLLQEGDIVLSIIGGESSTVAEFRRAKLPEGEVIRKILSRLDACTGAGLLAKVLRRGRPRVVALGETAWCS